VCAELLQRRRLQDAAAAAADAAAVAVDTGWCGDGLSRWIYTAWTKQTTARCVCVCVLRLWAINSGNVNV